MKSYFQNLSILIVSFISIYSFSDAQSAWETLAPLVSPPSVAAMATVNGKIYILSGSGSAKGAQTITNEYDPVTNTWSKKAKIPQACYWATANGVNGKIYVMGGGSPYPGGKYNFIYDPASDTWTTGDSLLSPRMYHSAAELDGKIYLIGAQNGDPVQNYFDEYDTQKNTWMRRQNILHNQAWYSSLASLDKKIYRIGGGGAPNNVTNYFESYNTETDSWSQLPDMQSKFHASVALTYNNRIYLIGGNANGKDTDSIFGYYPEINEWVPELFKLPEPRVYHRGVICNDCIYIFGGQNTHSDPIAGSLIRYCFKQTSVPDNNSNIYLRTFPNPCQGSFYIDLNTNNSSYNITVFDILGKPIKCEIEQVNDTQLFIQMNNPEKGLYFVKISKDDFIKVIKIIVD